MKKLLILVMAMFVAIAVHAKPLRICAQPSDHIESSIGCDAQIQAVDEMDVVKSVAMQAALTGPVILWINGKTEEVVQRFPALIQETLKYVDKFPWVYLYDELFWNGSAYAIEIGRHESEVLEGARIAHAKGLSTVITIMPDVILSPRFALKDINAFDGIAIDVYPSIRPTVPDLNGCRFSDNYLKNLVYCSAQKLRAMGFKGKIGYIYQAFGIDGEDEEVLLKNLLLQREAVQDAELLGASAVMAWGLYLGAPELAKEPIFQFSGTPFEKNVIAAARTGNRRIVSFPLVGTRFEYLIR